MSNPEVFRPKSNIGLGVFAYLMCATFVWSTFYDSKTTSRISGILLAVAISLLIYIFVIKPKITFYDGGVIVTNPLDEFSIGWNELIFMDTKWALSFETKDFTAYTWAAIAPSRRKAQSVHPDEIKGLDIVFDGSIRAADAPHSDSGAARLRAQIRINKWEERIAIGESAPCLDTYRKRNRILLVITAALAALSLSVGIL